MRADDRGSGFPFPDFFQNEFYDLKNAITYAKEETEPDIIYPEDDSTKAPDGYGIWWRIGKRDTISLKWGTLYERSE